MKMQFLKVILTLAHDENLTKKEKGWWDRDAQPRLIDKKAGLPRVN